MNHVNVSPPGKMPSREIEKIADGLNIDPADNLSVFSSEDIRVAAVQLLCKNYSSLADYVIDMNLYIADAVNRRAQLVCFPAYTGLLPASLLPQFSSIMSRLKPLEDTGLPNIGQLRYILGHYSDYLFDVYFYTMSALSARHGVYIMAGSTICYEKDAFRHRAFLFSDTGDLIGFQDKISLNRLERELQIEPACELKIFDTPLAAIAILTGEDTDYFEPARIAKNLGARLLVSPNAFTRENTPVNMALGLNMRVQENNLYGVQSALVGDTGLGFAAQGVGCLFSPNELLARKNGVLAQTSGYYEPEVICAKLNLDKLDLISSSLKQDKNPELLKKYIDRLY